MAQKLEGPLTITGQVAFTGTVTLPVNAVTNSTIGASVSSPIDVEKVEQQITACYAQPNTAAADETRVIHRCEGSGTVVAFRVGSIAIAVGDAVTTFDVKKNGSSILSSVKTINSGNTNRVSVDATLSGTPTYVEGDIFEVVIDGTIGTGTLPTGCFCQLVLRGAAE